ncbi:MAG: pantoate--beta-alanine ligase [Bacteroidota bacterium]
MKLIYNIFELEQYILFLKKRKKNIGFVPTMGALHKGHISLAAKARAENDVCVCSIFVNPGQFNNAEDFKNYPRSLNSDIELFEQSGTDAVFIPSEEEIYPEPVKEKFDLGGLDKIMEGRFRPGHFNGVAFIVKKLFNLIKPDRAYFGEKDFQQLAIIKYMVKKLAMPIKIITCPTIRENDGLAMSSRNKRLSAEERMKAPLIYETLLEAKEKIKKQSVAEVKKWVEMQINSCDLIMMEYFEVADSETLTLADAIDKNKHYNACIAVYVGNIRLIDNIKIL